MTDAIIFDFDGVIVDSEPAQERSIAAALESIGLTMSHDEFMQYIVGTSDLTGLARLGRARGRELSPAEVESLIGVKRRAFAELRRAGHIVPIPGTVSLVRAAAADPRLIGGGVTRGLAVCTGSRRAEVELMLREAGLYDLFSACITRDEVTNLKPHPEPYRRACEALGRPPERCVAVEDTPTGIRSAVAAGLRVAAVCHTFGPDALSEAHGVFPSTAALGLDELLDV